MSTASWIMFFILMRVPYRLRGRWWRRAVDRFDAAAVRAFFARALPVDGEERTGG